jgi:predicted phosphoribosyltransferase
LVATFRSRVDAGLRLAADLGGERAARLLVLAVPLGGVVTGAALASDLGAELDAVFVRKLRHPVRPEDAVGAIAEDGQLELNQPIDDRAGVSADHLRDEYHRRWVELEHIRMTIRRVCPPAEPIGRPVIVVDDGVDSGATLRAALRVVRSRGPGRLVVAVPVATAERLSELDRLCDRVVCTHRPENGTPFHAHYDDFGRVSVEQVVRYFRAATHRYTRRADTTGKGVTGPDNP